VPAHHLAEEYLDAYLAAADIDDEARQPLWRSLTKERSLGTDRMNRVDVFRMIKRYCEVAEIGCAANCHTFRATGITAYLLNGGTIEGRRRSRRTKALEDQALRPHLRRNHPR